MSVKELLEKEIESVLKILDETDVNSDQYKTAVESLVKLMDRYNTMIQNELSNAEKETAHANEKALKEEQLKLEREYKFEQLNAEKTLKEEQLKLEREYKFEQLNAEKAAQTQEYELKVKQAEDEQKDRKIRNILTAAGIVIPTGVTIWGVLKSFEFEKTGTVTTILGRGLLNKLLPRK